MWVAPLALRSAQKRLALKRSATTSVTLRMSGSTIICAPPMWKRGSHR